MGTFSIASIQHLDPGSAQVCEDTLMVFHQAAYWLRLCESQKKAKNIGFSPKSASGKWTLSGAGHSKGTFLVKIWTFL